LQIDEHLVGSVQQQFHKLLISIYEKALRVWVDHVHGGADHSTHGSATGSATSAAAANDSDVGACRDNAASGDVGCVFKT